MTDVATTTVDTNNFPPVLTAAQAASLLQVGQDRVYEMCQQGRLPHLRFGRSIRIPRDRLIEWMTSEADRAVQERMRLLELANRTGPPWKRLKTS